MKIRSAESVWNKYSAKPRKKHTTLKRTAFFSNSGKGRARVHENSFRLCVAYFGFCFAGFFLLCRVSNMNFTPLAEAPFSRRLFLLLCAQQPICVFNSVLFL